MKRLCFPARLEMTLKAYSLDGKHPAVGALESIAPGVFVAGGSFLKWLPPAEWTRESSRRSTFSRAFKAAREQCLGELFMKAAPQSRPHSFGREGPEIRWPEGYTGSLAHKGTVVLGGITSDRGGTSIGIDLELANGPGLDGLEALIAPEGLPPGPLRSVSAIVAFSAKEAAFKAFYHLERRQIPFSGIKLRWSGGRGTIRRAVADCPGEIGLEVKSRLTGEWIVSVARTVA